MLCIPVFKCPGVQVSDVRRYRSIEYCWPTVVPNATSDWCSLCWN